MGLGFAGDRLFVTLAAQKLPAARPAPNPPPAAPPPKPVRLLAVGDLMLGTPTRAGALLESPRSVFRAYQKTLCEADLAFGNLETSISIRGEPTPGKSEESLRSRKNFLFRAPPAAAEEVARAGFDVVAVANNHSMDYGPTALTDTLESLEEAEVATVGGGESLDAALTPVILVRNEQRFAFFGISDVLPPFSAAGLRTAGIAPARGSWFKKHMPEAIRDARKRADWVVVSVHWGQEKFTGSTPKQRRLGRRLIDWGADVVIGHHTHCLGPVEHYRGGLIHYSLGNFIGPRPRDLPAPVWEVTFEPGKRPTEQMLNLE